MRQFEGRPWPTEKNVNLSCFAKMSNENIWGQGESGPHQGMGDLVNDSIVSGGSLELRLYVEMERDEIHSFLTHVPIVFLNKLRGSNKENAVTFLQEYAFDTIRKCTEINDYRRSTE